MIRHLLFIETSNLNSPSVRSNAFYPFTDVLCYFLDLFGGIMLLADLHLECDNQRFNKGCTCGFHKYPPAFLGVTGCSNINKQADDICKIFFRQIRIR